MHYLIFSGSNWKFINKRVVHILIAKGESSGQYLENSGFNAAVPVHFVNQMSSDLDI